jgi:hypothetical protein
MSLKGYTTALVTVLALGTVGTARADEQVPDRQPAAAKEGVAGAVTGAVTGAAIGAVKGAITGGLPGAAAGAVEGAINGAAKGAIKGATQDRIATDKEEMKELERIRAEQAHSGNTGTSVDPKALPERKQEAPKAAPAPAAASAPQSAPSPTAAPAPQSAPAPAAAPARENPTPREHEGHQPGEGGRRDGVDTDRGRLEHFGRIC